MASTLILISALSMGCGTGDIWYNPEPVFITSEIRMIVQRVPAVKEATDSYEFLASRGRPRTTSDPPINQEPGFVVESTADVWNLYGLIRSLD